MRANMRCEVFQTGHQPKLCAAWRRMNELGMSKNLFGIRS